MEAVDAARMTRQPHLISRYLVAQVVCECYGSRYQAVYVTAIEGMQWAERAGDGYIYMVFLSMSCIALFLGGQWRTVLHLIKTGLAAAEKNGNAMQLRRSRSIMLFLLVETGDYKGALTLGEELSSMMVQGDSVTANLCHIALIRAYLGLKNYPRAQQLLQEISRKIDIEGMLLDGLS